MTSVAQLTTGPEVDEESKGLNYCSPEKAGRKRRNKWEIRFRERTTSNTNRDRPKLRNSYTGELELDLERASRLLYHSGDTPKIALEGPPRAIRP